jgi:hypothetical protein
MRIGTMLSALTIAICATLFGQPAVADVTIQYNEYSGSPTIGRGDGTSTDPNNPGYGAMRIFIEKVVDYTDEHGPDALPIGQKVIFQRDQSTGRGVNALRAGVQFANAKAVPKPVVADPTWGFIYNSVPFGMNFQQMLGFLYDAKLDGFGGNGIELAQAILDSRGELKSFSPSWQAPCRARVIFHNPLASRTATPETRIVKTKAMELAWPVCARRTGEFAICPRRRIS